MAYSGTAKISYSVAGSSITCQLINLGSYEYSVGLNGSVLWTLYTSSGAQVAYQWDAYSYGDLSTRGATFSGLSAGTYTLKAVIYSAYDNSYYAGLDDVYITIAGTGSSFTPTISIQMMPGTLTSNSVQIMAYNLSSYPGCSPKEITAYAVDGENTLRFSTVISYDAVTSQTLTLSGLTANTTYYVYCVVQYRGMNSGTSPYAAVSNQIAITTLGQTIARPAYFYWDNYADKVAGAKCTTLTALEWNRLLDNIDAVREYKGLTKYGFTRATQGGIFYAYMYNQVARAINGLYGNDAIAEVQSGYPVLAQSLNDLRDYINMIP